MTGQPSRLVSKHGFLLSDWIKAPHASTVLALSGILFLHKTQEWLFRLHPHFSDYYVGEIFKLFFKLRGYILYVYNETIVEVCRDFWKYLFDLPTIWWRRSRIKIFFSFFWTAYLFMPFKKDTKGHEVIHTIKELCPFCACELCNTFNESLQLTNGITAACLTSWKMKVCVCVNVAMTTRCRGTGMVVKSGMFLQYGSRYWHQFCMTDSFLLS